MKVVKSGKKRGGGRPKRDPYKRVSVTVSNDTVEGIKRYFPEYGKTSAFVQVAIQRQLDVLALPGQNPPDDKIYLTEDQYLAYSELIARLDAEEDADIAAANLGAKEEYVRSRARIERVRALLLGFGADEVLINKHFEPRLEVLRQTKFSSGMMSIACEFVVHLRTFVFSHQQQWREAADSVEEQVVQIAALNGWEEKAIRSCIAERLSLYAREIDEYAKEKEGERSSSYGEAAEDETTPKLNFRNKLRNIFTFWP
ncbi:hypothetical protein [Agrobacterium sp. LAD9]|uniref:hypothetical protein n=1 Tax=Agrobacterium sp. LAD9 TaxID=2055153 RepID=UPI000D1F49E9|nr:hypothetical protein [Agrobacterium sp. LAD9]